MRHYRDFFKSPVSYRLFEPGVRVAGLNALAFKMNAGETGAHNIRAIRSPGELLAAAGVMEAVIP